MHKGNDENGHKIPKKRDDLRKMPYKMQHSLQLNVLSISQYKIYSLKKKSIVFPHPSMSSHLPYFQLKFVFLKTRSLASSIVRLDFFQDDKDKC